MSDLEEYYNDVFIPVVEQFMERLGKIADEIQEKIGEKMSAKDKIENAKVLHLDDWNNGYSEGYQQGRLDQLKEDCEYVQSYKDRNIENPKNFPINYGTICSICIGMWNKLKEKQND